jgi:hypothetical protein
MAAAAEGLSKLRAPAVDCPSKVEVAGDFLTCWGDERELRGEKAAWAGFEKGVETGGVATASCEGVRPCWEAACFMGVDMMDKSEHGGWWDIGVVLVVESEFGRRLDAGTGKWPLEAVNGYYGTIASGVSTITIVRVDFGYGVGRKGFCKR